MPSIEEDAYYRQRAKRERAIAEAAVDERIAHAHLCLAEEYEQRAAAQAADPDAEKSRKD